MAREERGAVTAWAPNDRTFSVYVSERTELIVEALRDSIPLRSKAEVGRQAIEGGGLRSLPGYAAACAKADEIMHERAQDAARRAAVA